LIELIDLTRRSISVATHMSELASAVRPTGNSSDYENGAPEEGIGDIERLARLAKSEIRNDFPFLHSNSLMGIWGALEGMVEDLAISWMQYNPSILDQPKICKIRGPLVEFQRMNEQDRLRYLVTELQRDLGLELKGGATKFETLLTVVKLGGSVDSKVRDAIFEAQNLRNIFAHRAGIADRKFVANCPHLQYRVGDAVRIGDEEFGRVFFGLLTYGAIILNRCRAIESMPLWYPDFPGFEDAIPDPAKGDRGQSCLVSAPPSSRACHWYQQAIALDHPDVG
jgi:hypothetical protein